MLEVLMMFLDIVLMGCMLGTRVKFMLHVSPVILLVNTYVEEEPSIHACHSIIQANDGENTLHEVEHELAVSKWVHLSCEVERGKVMFSFWEVLEVPYSIRSRNVYLRK